MGLLFGAGCASTPDETARQCRYYTAIYEAYLAARASGEVSEAEVTAARVAAVFLQIHCNYQPVAPPNSRAASGKAPADENGVPIVRPPGQ